MATMVEVKTREDIVRIINEDLKDFPTAPKFNPNQLNIHWYANDNRIDWIETYIVYYHGYGVIGFTDGPL
jgi:uncharacterized membrane protein (UPF0182 family)